MKISVVLLFLFFYPVVSHAAFTVAAAANVSYVLEELCDGFKKRSGIDIKTVVASSGKLTAQIERGAPFDIFLSADMKYPSRLWRKGYTLNEPRVYATGSIVLWTLKRLDLKKGLLSLERGSIERVAIPNPKTAPYGKEATKAMKSIGVYDSVEDRIVYAESISQTNRYIVSKAVDIGITAKSVVMSPKMAGKGRYVDIDPSLYDPIEQGVVILKHAESGSIEKAKAFYDYIFSKEAKALFKKFGYGVK